MGSSIVLATRYVRVDNSPQAQWQVRPEPSLVCDVCIEVYGIRVPEIWLCIESLRVQSVGGNCSLCGDCASNWVSLDSVVLVIVSTEAPGSSRVCKCLALLCIMAPPVRASHVTSFL